MPRRRRVAAAGFPACRGARRRRRLSPRGGHRWRGRRRGRTPPRPRRSRRPRRATPRPRGARGSRSSGSRATRVPAGARRTAPRAPTVARELLLGHEQGLGGLGIGDGAGRPATALSASAVEARTCGGVLLARMAKRVAAVRITLRADAAAARSATPGPPRADRRATAATTPQQRPSRSPAHGAALGGAAPAALPSRVAPYAPAPTKPAAPCLQRRTPLAKQIFAAVVVVVCPCRRRHRRRPPPPHHHRHRRCSSLRPSLPPRRLPPPRRPPLGFCRSLRNRANASFLRLGERETAGAGAGDDDRSGWPRRPARKCASSAPAHLSGRLPWSPNRHSSSTRVAVARPPAVAANASSPLGQSTTSHRSSLMRSGAPRALLADQPPPLPPCPTAVVCC